jgi:transposase
MSSGPYSVADRKAEERGDTGGCREGVCVSFTSSEGSTAPCLRPRPPARELFAECGYDHDTYRRQPRARGITPRIARRGVAHGSGLGRHRWVVERGFAWLHAFKRLRTRYERRGGIHLGPLQLACALICYRHTGLMLVTTASNS